MPKKIQKIVQDAEFTPIEEPQPQPTQPGFDLSNVGEMVMVGRYKDGKEFVVPVNFDDVVKAKGYCEMGVTYFQLLIERHLYNMIRQQESGQ
jgi:hypothetical protein